eukprot:3907464-Rhodomonas_salina.1
MSPDPRSVVHGWKTLLEGGHDPPALNSNSLSSALSACVCVTGMRGAGGAPPRQRPRRALPPLAE